VLGAMGIRSAAKVVLDLGKMEQLAVIDSLEGVPVTMKRAKDLIRTKKYRLALHFGDHFSERLQLNSNADPSDATVISLIVDPAMNLQLVASVKATIQGVVQRHSILARLPGIVHQGLKDIGEQEAPEMASMIDELKPQLQSVFSLTEFCESIDADFTLVCE
jgi:hypothetical protein